MRWRRGARDGEFFVDVDAVEAPDPATVFDVGDRVATPECVESACSSFASPRVYTTVVGHYDDLALGCPGMQTPSS